MVSSVLFETRDCEMVQTCSKSSGTDNMTKRVRDLKKKS